MLITINAIMVSDGWHDAYLTCDFLLSFHINAYTTEQSKNDIHHNCLFIAYIRIQFVDRRSLLPRSMERLFSRKIKIVRWRSKFSRPVHSIWTLFNRSSALLALLRAKYFAEN